MPAWLASPLLKIAAFVAVIVIAGVWIALLQRDLAAAAAERDKATAQLKLVEMANKALSDGLDRVTADQAKTEARAAALARDLAAARGTVEVRTETVVKRIIEHATPADRDPAPPALRAVVDQLRSR